MKLVARIRRLRSENQQDAGRGVGRRGRNRGALSARSLEQYLECFNINPTAFLTFHRCCNNRKINSLRLLRALINVVHSAASRLFFHLRVL